MAVSQTSKTKNQIRRYSERLSRFMVIQALIGLGVVVLAAPLSWLINSVAAQISTLATPVVGPMNLQSFGMVLAIVGVLHSTLLQMKAQFQLRRVPEGELQCRRCQYTLAGLDPIGNGIVRCPECGLYSQADGLAPKYGSSLSSPTNQREHDAIERKRKRIERCFKIMKTTFFIAPFFLIGGMFVIVLVGYFAPSLFRQVSSRLTYVPSLPSMCAFILAQIPLACWWSSQLVKLEFQRTQLVLEDRLQHQKQEAA